MTADSATAEAPQFETLRLQRDGAVLVVTIDRADNPLNAVDGVLHAELAALFAWLKTERQARAILLTGTGRAFSAGGDFGWFPTLQDPAALEHLRVDARNLIWDLLDVRQPIVCGLNGHAMGLGASIALLCDVVIMARSATIGDPHVKVGLVAGDGGTIAWPLLLGPMLAKRYLLTGDAVTAVDAHRMGLAAEIVEDDAVVSDAMAFAQRLAAGAPLAIQHTKEAVNSWIKSTAGPAFDTALAAELRTFTSADHREALEALAEKRDPEFLGR